MLKKDKGFDGVEMLADDYPLAAISRYAVVPFARFWSAALFVIPQALGARSCTHWMTATG